MSLIRTLLVLLGAQMFALAAFAQTDASAPVSAEFGRASGGAIDVMTKGPSRISGTLSFTHSAGLFGGARYEGSLGGTIVPDRLWFFSAASVSRLMQPVVTPATTPGKTSPPTTPRAPVRPRT